MRVIDLSHRIEAGMTTYPGLPAPEITPYLTRADSRARYAPGTEFAMDVITMIGNTGTYLDAPFHRYADGADLAGLDLATLVDLPAEVFHLVDGWSPERRGIEAEMLADRDSVNIDDVESGGSRPAHSVLLGAGVHVVEHLTGLSGLPARGARFTAPPPAIVGFGTFPVRAYATIPDEA